MSISLNSISSSNFRKPMHDPDAYAQQYANQKGITLEEAKEELKSKFGDPSQGANIPGLTQQSNQSSIFSSTSNTNNSFSIGSSSGLSSSYGLSGVSSSSLPSNTNPDEYAQEYADKKGITLEEAKAELKALYGEPKKLDYYA